MIAILCSWCDRIVRNGSLPASHTCCTACVLKYFGSEEAV